MCRASCNRERATPRIARRPAPRGTDATPSSAAAASRAPSSHALNHRSPLSSEAESGRVSRPVDQGSECIGGSDEAPSSRARTRHRQFPTPTAPREASPARPQPAHSPPGEQPDKNGHRVTTGPRKFDAHGVSHLQRRHRDREFAESTDRQVLNDCSSRMARQPVPVDGGAQQCGQEFRFDTLPPRVPPPSSWWPPPAVNGTHPCAMKPLLPSVGVNPGTASIWMLVVGNKATFPTVPDMVTTISRGRR